MVNYGSGDSFTTADDWIHIVSLIFQGLESVVEEVRADQQAHFLTALQGARYVFIRYAVHDVEVF